MAYSGFSASTGSLVTATKRKVKISKSVLHDQFSDMARGGKKSLGKREKKKTNIVNVGNIVGEVGISSLLQTISFYDSAYANEIKYLIWELMKGKIGMMLVDMSIYVLVQGTVPFLLRFGKARQIIVIADINRGWAYDVLHKTYITDSLNNPRKRAEIDKVALLNAQVSEVSDIETSVVSGFTSIKDGLSNINALQERKSESYRAISTMSRSVGDLLTPEVNSAYTLE